MSVGVFSKKPLVLLAVLAGLLMLYAILLMFAARWYSRLCEASMVLDFISNGGSSAIVDPCSRDCSGREQKVSAEGENLALFDEELAKPRP